MLNLTALQKKEPNPFETTQSFDIPKLPALDLGGNTDIKTSTPAVKTGSLNTMALEKKPFFEPAPEVRIRDVYREQAIIAKNIGQEIARNVASAGVTVGSALGAVTQKQRVDEVQPPKVLEFLLRDDPIKPVEQRIADAELKLKDWGSQKDTPIRRAVNRNALAIAFVGIIADTGLDLTPLGGSKSAFKQIKNIDNMGDAFGLLKKLGVDDDIAKEFAEQVVKTKTDDVARKLLTDIAELHKSTRKVNTSALKAPTEELADSALHIPEQGVFARITKSQLDELKDEINKIPFTPKDRPHLTAITDNLVRKTKEVDLTEIQKLSPNIKKALDDITRKVDTISDDIAKAKASGKSFEVTDKKY
jgi:hypothetical protein